MCVCVWLIRPKTKKCILSFFIIFRHIMGRYLHFSHMNILQTKLCSRNTLHNSMCVFSRISCYFSLVSVLSLLLLRVHHCHHRKQLLMLPPLPSSLPSFSLILQFVISCVWKNGEYRVIGTNYSHFLFSITNPFPPDLPIISRSTPLWDFEMI